jgi:alkylhydroperoxidase family enzyme
MQVSLFVACPFCSDMNSVEREQYGITDAEVQVMQGLLKINQVDTFSEREQLALELAVRLSQTPMAMEQGFSERLHKEFTDREILVLTATASQVNYWARLIQFLGVAPAGFTPLSALLLPRGSDRSDH